MSDDPLKSALEEIAPKLDPQLQPLVASLLEDRQIEDAWQQLLQETLNEA